MEITQQDGAFILSDQDKKIGEITFIPYNDTTIEANHTYIDSDYRGQDLGLLLVDALVDYARAKQLTIVPTCPYVDKLFQKEAKYHDVWQQEN